MQQRPSVPFATAIAAMGAATVLTSGASAQTTVDSIIQANQAATGMPPSRMVAIRTTYAFSGMGLTGRYVSTSDLRDGRYRNVLTAGPVDQTEGFDGAHAWQKEPSGAVTVQGGGEQREAAVSEAYREANLWWRPDYAGAKMELKGSVREDGRSFDVLTVTPKDGKPFQAWFDTASHLLARTVEGQGAQTDTNSFLDYRRIAGIMHAGRILDDGGDGPNAVETLTLTNVTYSAAIGAAAFSTPESEITDASIVGGKAETSLPFRLVANRPYADVSVNGKGPYLFLFDTGATFSIAAPLAQVLGLSVRGSLVDHGAGEGATETGLAKVAEIAVAGATIKDQVAAVAPDALANVEALGDKGILGFETFRRFVVRIDYGQHILTLIDPKRFDAKDAGTPIPFAFEGNFLEVAGTFEGIPVRLVVDTGSRAEVLLNKPFADSHRLRDKHPSGIDAIAGWGVGGAARGYAMRADSFKVGPISIGRAVTFLSTQDKGVFAGSTFDGEIGGGILKRFVVTFDYAHQKMYLKPTQAAPTDVGTFDRAGMWFNKSQAGFVVVDVTRGGPAAIAGVEPKDEIRSVDGKVAKTLAVDELRRRLRNDPAGTLVRIKISRDGRLHTLDVTLHDQI